MDTRIVRPENGGRLKACPGSIRRRKRSAAAGAEGADQTVGQAIHVVLENLLGPAADLETLRRKQLLTGEEVQRLYGLNAGTLRNLRMKGRGPRYVKDGARVLYRHRDLEDYLASRTCRTEG